MKPTETMPEITAPDYLRITASDKSFALNVVVVYQDFQCRKRVMELCDRVTRSIGRRSFRLRFWSFAELDAPEAFEEAVLTAEDADVMIVSVQAAEQIHPRFCAWIDSWLSRRRRPDGTLIALISVSGWNSAMPEHVRNYLRGVAWEARLEFLPQEHAVAATADSSFDTAVIPVETVQGHQQPKC